jgi:hypothetical protein
MVILASVGAAALGVSGRMWCKIENNSSTRGGKLTGIYNAAKSRQAMGKKRTAIPAIGKSKKS